MTRQIRLDSRPHASAVRARNTRKTRQVQRLSTLGTEAIPRQWTCQCKPSRRRPQSAQERGHRTAFRVRGGFIRARFGQQFAMATAMRFDSRGNRDWTCLPTASCWAKPLTTERGLTCIVDVDPVRLAVSAGLVLSVRSLLQASASGESDQPAQTQAPRERQEPTNSFSPSSTSHSRSADAQTVASPHTGLCCGEQIASLYCRA
jgi:hypothetical protein